MCQRLCSDASKRTFGTLRSKPETITLVVQLLAEGSGVRAASRIARCHRDTVLRILKHAGQRSYDLLNRKLVDVAVKHVEADEMWTYCLKKSEPDTDPELDLNPWGDYYVYLGLESETKLLLMPTIGKRTEYTTERFSQSMKRCTSGRFQLTTDGYQPYKRAMINALGSRIDFAQFYKEVNMIQSPKLPLSRYAGFNHGKDLYVIRSGAPEISRITTAHVERVNLSLRTHNKRFNRKTICFSKDEEYLNYSVYLFVAHYNFCRTHSALGRNRTPAIATGLADKVWNARDLLSCNLI